MTDNRDDIPDFLTTSDSTPKERVPRSSSTPTGNERPVTVPTERKLRVDGNDGVKDAGDTKGTPVVRREGKAEDKVETTDSTAESHEGRWMPWLALLAAVILTLWQTWFSYRNVNLAADDTLRSVSNMGGFALSLVTLTLGLVSFAQRRLPKWPAISAISIGLSVLLIQAAAWLGSL